MLHQEHQQVCALVRRQGDRFEIARARRRQRERVVLLAPQRPPAADHYLRLEDDCDRAGIGSPGIVGKGRGHEGIVALPRADIGEQVGDQSERIVVEMNLTDRRAMLFPLLLGRSAMAGRFRIDCALSYTLARPLRSRPKDVSIA